MKIYANRYEISEHLGSGTSGQVLRARNKKTGLFCALKIFPLSGLTSTEISLPVFQAELDTLKRLNHPSIAKIYDAGFLEKDRECYIASELIEGEDLFKVTEGMSFGQIEELLVEALRAFNYMHQQKVNHFDIKPQNLLVTKEQGKLILKIIDFGFANFYTWYLSQPGKKDSRPLIGTAAYVAPEIIRGKLPDHRADLYSLGAAFYKALTRQLPFAGTTEQELHEMHLNTKPEPLTRIKLEIPEYLNRIILKLLEKEPDKRYISAEAVIEDLSLSSEKSYPVETTQTLLSYVPEKGELIGRKEEFRKFEDYYNDRIQAKTLNKLPYLIVHGEKGTGKSRFLEAVKLKAQKDLISTMTMKEIFDCDPSEIPSPCLVLGDDVVLDKNEDTPHFLEHFYKQQPILFVLSVSQLPEDLPEDTFISLKNFSKKETGEYIEKGTGLSPIPADILDTIYKQTEGNPLFVAEYVKVLLQKEIFKDSYGNWTKEMLADLGQEFQNIGAGEFIKKRLKEKLNSLNPDEDTRYILSIIALLNETSLSSLRHFSKRPHFPSFLLEAALKSLLQNGVLKVDSFSCYSFSNPLCREIILSEMKPSSGEWYCDAIADYLEKKNASQEKILYFRSRGGGPSAVSDLINLASLQRTHALHEEAVESLNILLNKKDITKDVRNKALLELGGISIEMGKLKEAEKWLLKVLGSEDKELKDPVAIEAMEQLGVSYYRQSDMEKAMACFNKGLSAAQKNNFSWLEVVLENRIALGEFAKGHIEKAEKLFREAIQIWKKKLNEDEKLSAIRSDIDSVYYLKGEFKKTVLFLEEFLKILTKNPSHSAYPVILYKLGRTYLQMEEFKKSEELLRKCLAIVKERKAYHWLYAVYNELGNLFMKQKLWAKSLSNYQHAFRLSRKTAHDSRTFFVGYNVGHILLRMKNWEESRKYFEFVIRNLEQKKEIEETLSGFHLFTSYLGLANVYRELKDSKKAKKYLEKAETIFKEKDYLKSYEQHIWQERIDIAKHFNQTAEVDAAMKVLEKLKKTQSFNWFEYKDWQETSAKVQPVS